MENDNLELKRELIAIDLLHTLIKEYHGECYWDQLPKLAVKMAYELELELKYVK